MEKLDPREREIARKLARYIAANPDDLENSKLLLRKLVGKRTLAQRRPLLRYFERALRREVALHEIVVEHAGPVTDDELDAIRKEFESHSEHSLRVRAVPNEDLIAGMRLTLGDNQYDASVHGNLQRLAANVR